MVAEPANSGAAAEVSLRDVVDDDLDVFFEHQRDPEGAALAAVASRDREAFHAHWARIRADDANLTKTVVADGAVVGNVVSFVRDGRREVGYWIGREHWGKGIATRALAELVALLAARPLYGYVAKHNAASIRVLQKCGFTLRGEDGEYVILALGAGDRA